MSAGRIPRDLNRVPVLGGASSADGETAIPIYGDPTTHELLVKASINAGDIQIGAVEIKNGTDDTRATVTAANALKVDGSAVTQPVSATDLDIRNLVFATDKVDISGSTNVTVVASDFDIRNLVFATDKVDVSGSTNVDVTATDLDIRNLVFATDKVDVSGSSNVDVVATDLDIRNLTSVSDSVEVFQATGTNLHTVIDALPNEGQQTMANSVSVAVASDQSDLPSLVKGTINSTAQLIRSTGTGELAVEIGGSNVSAFGDITTAENEPVLQLDFVYGINTQTGVSTTANSATVDTDSGRLRLQSGTNSAGSAIFNSRKIVKYRAGQGVTARFTPVFATGTASNTQIWGIGNANDGYFFGYNGTTFGILHRIRTVDTWIAQSTWNGDKCDGTGLSGFSWNKQVGNVVMIRYPYLGYGDIRFYVQNSTDGNWILCHTIRYGNTVATTQAGNPSFFFYGQNLNSGNTTNLTMYCGSVGIFLNGKRSFVSNPKWAIDNFKTGITTEINLLGLKNCTTFNGVTNRALIRLNSLSCSNSANTTAFLRLKLGATIGGAPSFTTINGTSADGGMTITSGNSIASYDVAGTTVTGGIYQFNISISPAGMTIVDLTPFDFYIAPAEIMTFSGQAVANTTIGVSVNWTEDI